MVVDRVQHRLEILGSRIADFDDARLKHNLASGMIEALQKRIHLIELVDPSGDVERFQPVVRDDLRNAGQPLKDSAQLLQIRVRDVV